MRYHVLGPLRLVVDGADQPLGGPKQRLVLALLLAANGRPVSAGQLIDGVWGQDQPATARKALQVHVHHLRVGVGVEIETESGGYSLPVGRSLDAADFEVRLDHGAGLLDGEPARARAIVSGALQLWNGTPYADLDDSLALAPEIERLQELRVEALAIRTEADLSLGRHTLLIGELGAIIREFPLHERFRCLQMIALCRAGRSVEALRSYERLRRYLADEMGLEPCPQARQLVRQILNGDPSLSGSTWQSDLVLSRRGLESERIPGQNDWWGELDG